MNKQKAIRRGKITGMGYSTAFNPSFCCLQDIANINRKNIEF